MKDNIDNIGVILLIILVMLIINHLGIKSIVKKLDSISTRLEPIENDRLVKELQDLHNKKEKEIYDNKEIPWV